MQNRQASNVNSVTERLLVDVGIAPGMRVIDLGCGAGEVSLLLARMVGDAGQVLGIDHDAQAIAMAQERVKEQKLSHVGFLHGDLSGPLPGLAAFDAVVGRRVLMYLADPVATLRSVVAALKPGGIVAIQETDATMVPGRKTPLPLHDKVVGWMWQTVVREGANIHMGFDLPSVLEQAGLTVEQVRAEAGIQGQDTHLPLPHVIRAMLPRIIRHGVATEEEIGLDTLEQRLAVERGAESTVYISDMAFCAWARKP